MWSFLLVGDKGLAHASAGPELSSQQQVTMLKGYLEICRMAYLTFDLFSVEDSH